MMPLFRHIRHPDISDCITYRLCVYMYNWPHSLAIQYRSELCRWVSFVSGCQYLRSACRVQLDVTRYRLTNYREPSFICVPTAVWNTQRHCCVVFCQNHL